MTIKIIKRGRESVKRAVNQKSRERRERLGKEVRLRSNVAMLPRNDLLPGVTLEHRRPGDLKSAKRRLRKAEHRHVEEVCRSITAFGFCVPILIDGDGTIVDGHIRFEAARRLGLEAIPCIVVDHLSDDELRLLSININRLAENGEWNLEELSFELADLQTLDMDLTLTGFDDIELDVLLQAPVETGTVEEDLEEGDPEADPITILGDLWCLGDHRLLCGDATKQGSYTMLMGDERARMVFSDPPYGIPIQGFVSGLGKVKHEDFVMGCGEQSPEEFQVFLRSYLEHCRGFVLPGSVVFACFDWRGSHTLVAAAKEAGLTLVQMCVWDKGSGSMGGSLYRNAYELVHVYCSGPTPAVNNVQLGKSGRDRNNIQHCPGANRRGSSAAQALELHPTPKPVELVEDYILDVSNRGDIVLDPFVGSGTTIVAAERCGRRAFCLELDPKYVDRAIRRWEALTGQTAIHEPSGLTLDELARERKAERDGD